MGVEHHGGPFSFLPLPARVAVGFSVAGAGVFLLYHFDPAKSGLFPPCPFHYLTGMYCPGCGSLRATHALLHAQFLRAVDLNPLMVLMLPVVVLLFLRPNWFKQPWRGWGLLGLITAYWVLRNIPVFPFSLLAP
ncbi:MAG: DUF2752 domain-containing protein [Thermogutta sp.]|uniref:DUF2752 domain-containing protein n=1 Tax=Thermogutta TaxID=1676125 RepID=UPI000BA86B4B|nr:MULTISPECIES: DUF2752 domain-containing protein [Thermogutta]MBC7353723.1 DUF2752 domain-containing protein [Thermogutta sp.]